MSLLNDNPLISDIGVPGPGRLGNNGGGEGLDVQLGSEQGYLRPC